MAHYLLLEKGRLPTGDCLMYHFWGKFAICLPEKERFGKKMMDKSRQLFLAMLNKIWAKMNGSHTNYTLNYCKNSISRIYTNATIGCNPHKMKV